MGQAFDLDLLRTFVAVSELESFAAAAKHVHRTQSAVTQQIQRLEKQVGVKLFRRSGRQKVLTRHGLTLLDYARRILGLHDEAVRMLGADEPKGPVRLGAPPDVADTILPSLLRHFSRQFPTVQVEIQVARSILLMDALKRGEIDLTVSTLDGDYPRIALRTSPSVWLCATEFKHDGQRPLPLVLADSPSLFRRMALESLRSAGIPWRLAYTASTLVGIRAAVRAGLGVTVRTIEMLSSDLKVLGPADGLPQLPDVTFYLYLRDVASVSAAARELFRSLASSQ
ncbi:MAG: transcriptional regulator LrhA [Betaproteobacteria bacterium]|nr:transcriptional regulator LrhA [Betaproteobacteria bacterium]